MECITKIQKIYYFKLLRKYIDMKFNPESFPNEQKHIKNVLTTEIGLCVS